MFRSEIINHDITQDVIAPGGRIGLIALATDFNSEQDLRRMFPDDVEIFTNRVVNANPLTLQNLRNMTDDISRAAAGILPGLELDAIIYGCTSGSIAIGVKKVEQLIQTSLPGVLVTNPVSAALAAFKHLNVQRLSILTPYIEEVNIEMAEYFERQGIEVINISGLGYESDIDITAIPPQEIANAANRIYDPKADCLFIACTALRASLVISVIEQSIKKPVISSNQALVWHSLKIINHPQNVYGFGSLLEESA